MNKLLLSVLAGTLSFGAFAQDESTPVTVTVNADRSTSMKNGMMSFTIGSNGRVSFLKPFNRRASILGTNGIYFDYTASANAALSPDKVELIADTEDYAEVLYSNTQSGLKISQGYILRRDDSAIYTYVIIRGSEKSSTTGVKEARVCVRLGDAFINGYVDETMNGTIPTNSEMATAEKAENTIQDATYRMADGSIYTKYNWAQYIDRDLFHGLMDKSVGVWNIPVSYEWLNGGPMRQELTVHATSKSPISIQMLQGEHFGGAAQIFKDGEEHIYGPFMIYVNQGTQEEMIADARARALQARSEWPFKWFKNDLYPTERPTVKGRLVLPNGLSPEGMKMVLADSEDTELIRKKHQYMFWANADAEGNFEIPAVRPGNYSLYAFATKGSITDEMKYDGVTVEEGSVTDLGDINWTPDNRLTLLWQIGEADRLSDGFRFSDQPRAYGDWEKVPATNNYYIGQSTPEKNWYYAQTHNGSWNIYFDLEEGFADDVVLTASVAGASNSPVVGVSVNGKSQGNWSFYNDAAIYRSGKLGGRHCVKQVVVPASVLKPGEQNKIALTMSGIKSNGGVMWDCVKLETDALTAISDVTIDAATAADGPAELFNLQGIKVDPSTAAPGVYIERRGTSTRKVTL